VTQYRLEALAGDRVALAQRYFVGGVTRWRILGPVLHLDDQGGPVVLVTVHRRFSRRSPTFAMLREKLTGLELWREARRRHLR